MKFAARANPIFGRKEKNTMKRVLIFASVFLMAASLYAVEGPTNEHQRMIDYLQLTPAQQSAWQNAHDAFDAATKPLFERIGQIGRETETALKSASPDACAIGNSMIAQTQVAQQIKAQKTALMQKLESVLTPDQKTKFDAYQAAQPQMMERHKINMGGEK